MEELAVEFDMPSWKFVAGTSLCFVVHWLTVSCQVSMFGDPTQHDRLTFTICFT